MVSLPSELAVQIVKRMRNAVDMGNITDLKSIAEDLKSQSNSYTDFSNRIFRFTEDFDFDAILRLADELEKRADRD
jgi:hypothetical protein